MTKTSTIPKLAPGQLEDLPISKIINLQNALDNIVPVPDPYEHPSQTVIDTGVLSTSSVISRIQVNTLGHVTSIATRSISLSDLGAQPEGNYELLSNKSTAITLGTSNVLYPTQNAVKTYVDGKTSNSVSNSRIISAGDGITGGGDLTANRSFSVDSTVLRTTSNTQSKTGLLRIVRGSSLGEIAVGAWDYPDNNGGDYNLRLYSNGLDNNVKYIYKQKVILGNNDVSLDVPVISFKNAITIIGDNDYNDDDLDIEVYYNGQTNPATRHPLKLYVAGDSVFHGSIKTQFPGTTGISTINWKLGANNPFYGSTTPTQVIEVELNGIIFELYGRVK